MTRYRDDRFDRNYDDRYDDRFDRDDRQRQFDRQYADRSRFYTNDRHWQSGMDDSSRDYQSGNYGRFDRGMDHQYGQGFGDRTYSARPQSYSQDDARSYGPRPSDTRYGMNPDQSGMGYSRSLYGHEQSYADRYQGGAMPSRSYGQSQQYDRGYTRGNQDYNWEGLRHSVQQGPSYGSMSYDAPQFGNEDRSSYGSHSYGPYGQHTQQTGGYQTRSMSGQYVQYQSGSQYGYRSDDQGSYLQSYQGKGPKGYQRSDDRIKEMVSDALEDAHDVDANNIEVQVQNGEVTLTGTVSDRMQKRLAADRIEHLRGVKDVHNQLRVQQYGQQSGQVMSSLTSGNQSSLGNTGGQNTSGTISTTGTTTSTNKS